jgi:Mn2+/Fe2+ NRAMP family transporter
MMTRVEAGSIGIRDCLKTLLPYMMLLMVFLMSLAVYGIHSKGQGYEYLDVYVKLVFPVFVVTVIYMMVLKFVPYAKRIIESHSRQAGISPWRAFFFLVANLAAAASIFTLFFYILNKL